MFGKKTDKYCSDYFGRRDYCTTDGKLVGRSLRFYSGYCCFVPEINEAASLRVPPLLLFSLNNATEHQILF